MKLVELEPQFVKLSSPSSWRDVETLDEADGIWFLCPLCFNKNNGNVGTHGVMCWFRGKVPDDISPGPGRWTPTGTDFSNLSLSPSVWLSGGGCGWHGHISNGMATLS